MLVVFSGLPGTGKTSIARLLAKETGAAYLRIDTIEQSLEASRANIKDAGYNVAFKLAEENLRLGNSVIADAVNADETAREAWRAAAQNARVQALEIEVICSDAAEHRRRIESRSADITGHVLPSWQEVLDRKYEAWQRQRLIVDTASKTPEDIVELIRQHINSAAKMQPDEPCTNRMKP